METLSTLLALCEGNSPVTGEFPHKGQWRGALMISLISAWTNVGANHRDTGDLRRHRPHYNVTVMNDACIQRGTGIYAGSHPNHYTFIFVLLMYALRVIVSVMRMSCVMLEKINYYATGMKTFFWGNTSRITVHLWGDSTGHQWIPLAKKRWYEVYFCLFDVNLNKLLNRYAMIRRWFEKPWRSHDVTACNGYVHRTTFHTWGSCCRTRCPNHSEGRLPVCPRSQSSPLQLQGHFPWRPPL